jgi:hypothetical protein
MQMSLFQLDELLEHLLASGLAVTDIRTEFGNYEIVGCDGTDQLTREWAAGHEIPMVAIEGILGSNECDCQVLFAYQLLWASAECAAP